MSRTSVLALVLLVAATLMSDPAQAAWPNQSGINLPVSNAISNQQTPVIVTDRAGGAIITWTDLRSGSFSIFAQRVLASGTVDAAWPANGRAISTVTMSSTPTVTSDGAGGAIIAWQDFRGAPTNDIYAQHVLASGVLDPAWPAGGRAVCAATFNQLSPAIVSDGAGGAIVAWQDARATGASFDIYAQHVLASGAVDGSWPVDGRALCTAANDQAAPVLVSDGAGGAIVAWTDARGGANNDIYAQHVLATGTVDVNYPTNGQAVCTAANDQETPTIVGDGSGGAIITWGDFRGGGNYDIYTQHVPSGGSVDWTANGLLLCGAANNQRFPTITSDGNGGAIITWQDTRTASFADIYAQHVLAYGAVDAAWPADGRAICTAAIEQQFPTITSDGAGGAIITWQDNRTAPNQDIFAQHVLTTGVVDATWPVDGRAICTASNTQQQPVIASDGAGGAIITWTDTRSGTGYDVYAQRVARFGYLGTPEAEITAAKDVPNDDGGKVKLSWNASWLDTGSDPNLSVYEVYRSVPPNVAAAAIARGAYVLRGFDQMPVPGRGAVVMGAQGYAWEYLASQNALHYLPSYSYLATTASDSTGYQNQRTAFMIVARNTSGSMYWLSRPDSAYSVDNLPPLAPAPFLGQYSGSVSSMHWRPNGEVDLANYRLYRGSTNAFTPSPANRIATPTDTLYDDPAGHFYVYKLSAVDIHGNESGYTTLVPSGTVDVTPAAGLEFALDPIRPNPIRGRDLAVAFVLPTAGEARLELIDVAGRRVAEQRVTGAGRHTVSLGGRGLPAGVYMVRLTQGASMRTRRAVVLE